MKKLKNLMTMFLCMFVLTGVFASPEVYATGGQATGGQNTTGQTVTMPNISMNADGSSLNIGEIGRSTKGQLMGEILVQYRSLITFLAGIALISMIGFFIINLIALGNSKGNPQERQKAITGLIVSGIATAGLGSVTLFTALFYNMLGEKGTTAS